MKLSIVIVSWNTKDLLGACLRSVYSYPLTQPFEVWVVDNHSQDDSVAMVRAQFPQVKLIASEENLGFSGGNNRAIPHCQGEYILLLNPDTEVKPEALNELVAFMDGQPDAAAAGFGSKHRTQGTPAVPRLCVLGAGLPRARMNGCAAADREHDREVGSGTCLANCTPRPFTSAICMVEVNT